MSSKLQLFSRGDFVLAPNNSDDDDDDDLYVAKIASANLRDGTYSLWYMDGEKHDSVPGERLEALDLTEEELANRPLITVGMRIKARHYGELNWFDAVVMRIDNEGFYEIRYHDGDEEIKVPAHYIKFPYNEASGNGTTIVEPRLGAKNTTQPFYVSQNVWAQYEGGDDEHEAKIVKINANGTYNLHYMDGDKERNVDAKYLYPIDLTQQEIDSQPPFKERCRVKARYFSASNWHDGVVTKVNKDGTYDIDYDDGDKERHVQAKYMRVGAATHQREYDKEVATLPQDTVTQKQTRCQGNTSNRQFCKGEFVLAPWHPHDDDNDLYVAKIASVNPDGTSYGLWYMDGGIDDAVPGEQVEALDLTQEELDERPPITVGMRVKARHYGELNWFDAVVTGIDDFHERFYNILYDDGDEEIKVPARYIKLPFANEKTTGSTTAPHHTTSTTHPFYVGQNVWGQYEGGGDDHEAKIVKINADGTYNLHYMNGGRENNVPAKYLYPIDLTQQELDAQPPFSEGCRVRARYFSASNWHDGVIMAVNEDGTYDIDFDDGDKERLVQAKYIRLEPGTAEPDDVAGRLVDGESLVQTKKMQVQEKVEHPDHVSRSDMESLVQQTKCIGVQKERAEQPDACLSNVAALRPRPTPESNTSSPEGPAEKRRKLDDDAATVTSHESSTPPAAGVAVECPCRCIIL